MRIDSEPARIIFLMAIPLKYLVPESKSVTQLRNPFESAMPTSMAIDSMILLSFDFRWQKLAAGHGDLRLPCQHLERC